MNTETPEDPQRQHMRERLEEILTRTDRARAWGDAALPLRSLVNRDGYVPIKTRLSVDDLDLLESARAELLCFSELGLRLLDLHQPRDAGGITSDAAHPILRCRSCMWRWPCPTFRAMSEALESLPVPEPGSGEEPDGEPSGGGAPPGAAGPHGPSTGNGSAGSQGSFGGNGAAGSHTSSRENATGSRGSSGTNGTSGSYGESGANGTGSRGESGATALVFAEPWTRAGSVRVRRAGPTAAG